MSYFIKVKCSHSQETNMATEGEWGVEVINKEAGFIYPHKYL